MKVSDFTFDLPEHLIAQEPLPERSASRLLHLIREPAGLVDRVFSELPSLLNPGDLLVFNNTRVIPARLHARKPSGGRVEVMIERLTGPRMATVQLRANRKPAPGTRLLVGEPDGSEGQLELELIEREGEFWRVEVLAGPDWPELLERVGHMPLPPYIQREDTAADRERYQTVYGQVPGAVAAPTAGLHFDEKILSELDDRGVQRGWCTLHVGAGTFQPVRVEDIKDHEMHAEWLQVDQTLVDQIRRTRAEGGRVIAVGTTAVRSLETAAAEGAVAPYTGDSRLFIYPGFEFKVVDGLITNFHLPGSTLMMLVSALAGRDRIMAAYQHAIDQEYRFFSYGDSMFID
ncbi:S-adenosylmethionine:tRNA ribosyltransferase-isomerase [Leptolyngbya valderiana BDU 20041]|nr:S-adenosylmethionine:tRNA ribosyltransferase-isomerase [Leptolyngbya valderiana BDU 20041]